MDCDDLKNRLRDYFENALPHDQRRELERHGNECVPCGDLLRVAGEITCRDVAQFLDDYVEGHLAAERQAVFERHLAICAECWTYLASYQATISAAQDAFDREALPDAMPQALVAAVLDALRRERR